MEEQAQFLEGNPDSQVKNAETNITENKKIELNTIHGEGSASEDLEDLSEIPSILLPGRNKTLYLSKPVDDIIYEFKLYSKCIFNKDFKSIRFTDGSVVARPVNTPFRVGYEVFICSRGRPEALGKKLTFLGVFLNNKKNPQYCSALLLDEQMFQMHQRLKNSSETNDFSIKVFRITPIDLVAKVPGGKEFSTENSTLIDEAGSYAAVYFADFLQKKKLLNDLDFLELKVKTEPTKKSSRILLAKKQNSELLLNTPDLSPLDSGLKFPTTPSLGVNVIDINQLFGGNKPTPPFVRKITQKLSASVSAQITKSLTTNTSLEREQKKSAKLSNENKSLKAKIAEQAAIIQSLQKTAEFDVQAQSARHISTAAKLKFISPEATGYSQPTSDHNSSSQFSISDSSATDTEDSESERAHTKKKNKNKKGDSESCSESEQEKKKKKKNKKLDSESSSESEKEMKKRKKNKRKCVDSEFSSESEEEKTKKKKNKHKHKHKKNTSNKKHSLNNKLCKKKQRKHT